MQTHVTQPRATANNLPNIYDELDVLSSMTNTLSHSSYDKHIVPLGVYFPLDKRTRACRKNMWALNESSPFNLELYME